MDRLSSIEDRIKSIALESYVRGLSTRDIEQTFQDKDGNPMISKSGVSQMSKTLYEQYDEFSRRDLSELDIVYLFIDGVYEAVKKYTNKQAILCAWAICSDGTKQLLHLEATGSERSESWESFFQNMLNRGLRQPLLIISDGSKGIISAITKKFPRAQRQRCIAHKIRNILSKLPRDAQSMFKERLRSIYYAPDMETAKTLAAKLVNDYGDTYASAIKCFNDDLSACLQHLDYPEGHRRNIRTTNLIERAFVEEKRRTKIIPEHAHEKGAVGLVFAVLIRASKSWRKVKMVELDLAVLKNIRKLICPESNDNNQISYELAA
jgi:transposase-like protein